MTKLTFTFLAGAGLLIGVPAAAQTTYDPYPSTYGTNAQYSGEAGIQNRLAQLQARLESGVETGAITNNEARPLRQQIRYLAQLERRYAANGLSQTERKDLQRRFRYTRQQLRAADPDNSRYARWDTDNNDPYADTGYTGYADAGARYQQVNEVCRTQSGLKGILGSVFGTDRCLRVGERVNSTASLGAVPDAYRNEFPDTNAFTHRYIDGNVVRIDTRTAVVANIYNVQYGG